MARSGIRADIGVCRVRRGMARDRKRRHGQQSVAGAAKIHAVGRRDWGVYHIYGHTGDEPVRPGESGRLYRDGTDCRGIPD